MEFRTLGKSGLKVSVVGLGCNNFGGRLDRESSLQVVRAAVDHGITLFDTADVYGGGMSEEIVGAGVKDCRDRVIIATKFGSEMGEGPYNRGGARVYVRRAVEASLRRLGTEYIDLYQMHWYDRETPLEETLSTLDDLVHEGKVRYIGCSNFSGWQIADADWLARTHGWTPFISAQNQYSLVNRDIERDFIPACSHFNIGMLPYFPLASGLLTGKYRRAQAVPEGTRLAGSARPDRWLNDANFDVVESLDTFAREHHVSLLEVAIGGLAAQPKVASVIAGATKPEQVEANVRAGSWVPTVEEIAEINRLAPTARPA